MNIRRCLLTVAGIIFIGTFSLSARQTTSSTSTQTPAPAPAAAPAPSKGGWTLPPTADEEKNPFAGDEKAVASGKQLFGKKCERCHGPGGKGDGPDADPDAMQDMDLTNPRRAARNSDGIVFYKIWNGRSKPKMPAQKDEMTKDQVWQVVSYVQTLRQKS
jgi:mono/diheme cytochrome c family protein